MRRTTRRREAAALLAGIALTALALGACSHAPAPPVKDPTQGEFYTPEEMVRLAPAERDRYCSYMESTLRDLKQETQTLQVRLDSLTTVEDTLRNQSIRVTALTRDASNRVRELRKGGTAISAYEVKAGDTLRRIAGIVYGDPTRWRDIYLANQAAIGAEDAELKPGLRLAIPASPGATQAKPSGTAPPGGKPPAPTKGQN